MLKTFKRKREKEGAKTTSIKAFSIVTLSIIKLITTRNENHSLHNGILGTVMLNFGMFILVMLNFLWWV
jgi:hypothetical protein